MTLEELLELPSSGWQTIEKMTEVELEVYLKDILIIEPVSEVKLTNLVLPGVVCQSEKAEEPEDDNPIKMNKKKKSSSVIKLEKSKAMDAEIAEMIKELE